MKFFLALFGLLAVTALGQSFSLNGHKVYRANFSESSQILTLYNEMFEKFDKIFWLYVDPDQKYAEIVVSPSDEKPFLELLEKLTITWDFMYEIKDAEEFAGGSDDGRKHYNGYKVYYVQFTTDKQFNLLLELKNNSLDLMFWQLSNAGQWADIMVPPNNINKFEEMLDKYGFTYTVKIDDVEKAINNNQGVGRFAQNFRKSYKGYKIYKVKFTTEEQFETLNRMKIESGENSDFNVLQLSHSQHYADILVGPTNIKKFIDFSSEQHWSYKCVCEDVGEIIKST